MANTPNVSTGNWCLSLPTQSVVQYSATDGSTTVTRTKSLTPDLINCRLTQIVTEPNRSTYNVTEAFTYDGFGNISTDTVTGAGMAARQTQINWGTTGQYPISVTNALNQVTQFGYDPLGKGVLTSQTDPNNLPTTWGYDTFARKNLETRPDGTSTAYNVNLCSSTPGSCPSPTDLRMWVQQISKDTSGNALHETRSFYDEYDRPRFVLDQNLTGGFDYKVHEGYDALGHKVLEYVPGPSESSPYHWYALDLLGRVGNDTLYNSSAAVISQSSAVYAGRTTTLTDAQSKQTTKVTDVMGRLVRSMDANGYYQSFGYDAFGSLTQINDSQSNTLFAAQYAYGVAAFMTAKTDMDAGTWTYSPDALGEVLSYTDTKGQGSSTPTASFTYDPLSRKQQRIEAEGTTIWNWGSVAANHNIGQLQSVSSPGGYSETYTYDNLGRLSDQQIISDATYNYGYTYNPTTGLPNTLIYPISTSGYRLTLQYGYQYGILNTVSDANASTVFWHANNLNPWGQITQETLGNGLVTNRSYDPMRGWLLSTQCGSGGGACLLRTSLPSYFLPN